jgi:hypothetical protein
MWSRSSSVPRVLLVALLAAACGPIVVLSDEGTEGSSDEGSTSSGAITTTPTTTTPPPGTSTTATTATTTTTGSVTLDGMDSVGDDPPPPLDLPTEPCFDYGSACIDPAVDCCSGNCYVVGPLGGVCSECDEDSDCPQWGCSPGSPLTGEPAVCGNGGPGSGCESDEACQPGYLCNIIIDIPGIVETSTCSECVDDLDCSPGTLCAPTYDLSLLSGSWSCIAPMSLPDTAGCDAAGSGDQQCASGNCAEAALMGIPLLGACSQCDEDADCGGGSCVLPEVVVQGKELLIEPGYCQ